jgi:two-component system, NtrC family, nitrogen regulation sensor histidine kinase NtrY
MENVADRRAPPRRRAPPPSREGAPDGYNSIVPLSTSSEHPLRRAASAAPRDVWAPIAALVVLAVARWLQAPAPLWVAVAVVALLVLGVMGWRGGRVARWRRVAFAASGTVFVLVAAAHHREVTRLAEQPEVVRSERSRAGGAALQREFAALDLTLQRLTAAAMEAPTGKDAAFAFLGSLVDPAEDHAVVVGRAGRPFAWAGRLLVPVDSLAGAGGVLVTPFYTVAYAVEASGDDVVVATALLHAERPAEQLSRPLDARVADAAGVERFIYRGPEAAAGVPDAVVLSLRGDPVLAARAVVAPVEVLMLEAGERALPRVGLTLAALVLLLIATAWRRDTGIGGRLVALAVAFAALAMVPLSAFSNVSPVFDPTFYFVAAGWRFTANVGALAITCTLLLLGLLSALRAGVGPRSRTQALLGVMVVAGLGPFLLRELARGIQVPGLGVPTGLWLAWQVTLFLAAVTVLLFGVTAGQAALGARGGLPAWIAPTLAAVAAVTAPLVLEAPGRFPPLHPALWILAIGALAFTRRARRMVLPVAFVAASGAVTLVWFSAVRDRVELAQQDVRGLGAADPDATILLQRYAMVLDPAAAARSRVEILARHAQSDLSAADYPTEVMTWAADGTPMADLRVGRGPGSTYGVNLYAAEAQRVRGPLLQEVPGEPGVHLVLAVPHVDGTVTTVVLAPRTRLVAPDPFGALLGSSPLPTPEPPYTLRLGEPTPEVASAPETRGGGVWSRDGPRLHGDWEVAGAGGMTRRLHATVELRSFDALVIRGALLILLDLAVLGAIWLLIVAADGAMRRWWRLRRPDLLKSYRTRLSVALFACFLLPSVLFGLWSFQRVQADDRQARDLLVRETLRGIAASTDTVQLAGIAARFETPLFLYADGLLVLTSDPVLDALAPLGRLLPAGVARTLAEGDEASTGREMTVGPSAVRLGYRAATDSSGVSFVLAAPARMDERLLDRRRNDLALFLLFALALGALAALWASGAASRQLSRPIRELRDSALALARGERALRLTADPPVEFTPVFNAFRQMTAELAESQEALETAERRLAATLRNVASGVVAVDDAGRVTFSNPRAEAILGRPLAAGTPVLGSVGAPLGPALDAFRTGAADDDAMELDLDGRRLQVRFARLARGARRVVVTIDDVTDVARAERVLAWGEMARQVAHEIKNPLTPMRLGMQHLRRARRDGRVDFDRVLEENTARVLAEIDRLDEIARAFSRYGTVPVEDAPAEAVDVAAVARDVLELERMGAEGLVWDAAIPPGEVRAAARDRELREVLLNLLENARFARARRVAVRVAARPGGGAELRVEDDGEGIPDHLLARVFEPHFSTRTSGSGLGLAISRRLIERWGGEITAESRVGAGTTLVIRLAPPPAP